MRFAMVATGGIGGFLAVRLTQAGHEVACLARGAHLNAIRSHGLRLSGDAGEAIVRPWRVSDKTEDFGPVDVVILGVKANVLEAAAEACLPLLGPDTVVVPFLNGVEAVGRTLHILPQHAIAEGVAYISTTIGEPGHIFQTGTFSRFVFGERTSEPSKRISALRSAFLEAGIDAPEVDDVEAMMWTKLILMTGMAGTTASARCTLGDIQTNPALGRLFRDLVGEAAILARARGIAVPDSVEADTWAFAQTLPKPMRASAAIDLERGSSLEIPWITGAVMRLSEEAGLDAPVSRSIVAVLDQYIQGAP